MNKTELTKTVKELAIQCGFTDCGIAKAQYIPKYADAYRRWITNGYQADMHYMENHPEKRTDPTKLVEGAKSVISLLYNYYPQKELPKTNNYRIARYAYGKDYHFVVKDKLNSLLEKIEQVAGTTVSRCFIDTAPVLDRAWAEISGLGWIGKNSMLINRKFGSYQFIGEIITSLELEYDQPSNNYCGGCTKCIDACPTQAIIYDGVIDSNKCISYHTIESRKEKIPEHYKDTFEDNIFGCDICQEVCPWNKFSIAHQEPDFLPQPELMDMNKEKWQTLDQEKYQRVFKKSAAKRAKFSGIKRNIDFLSHTF